MPAHFGNGRKFDAKKSLQDFDAKENYLHPKNQPVSILDPKASKNVLFTSLSSVHMMLFQIYAG